MLLALLAMMASFVLRLRTSIESVPDTAERKAMTSEKGSKPEPLWVVMQNGCVIMKLPRSQAKNKVANENRMGFVMNARPATPEEINPPKWVEEECDD